jgi:hypothetical protein
MCKENSKEGSACMQMPPTFMRAICEGRSCPGFEHVEEVVALVFAYIGLLRGPDGVTAERFQQFTDLARLGFNFAGATALPSLC